MKSKFLISILLLGLMAGAFGQNTIELTFTAENNDQYVPLDSIFIENLTQGGDTTLYTPDTVLVLDYVTGVGESIAIEENTFSVSQNYPNPFIGKTEVNLYLPEMDDIKITIRDILGRELTHYKNTLNRGNHNFAFYSGIEKYYLLTITGKHASLTIKMLNAGSHITTSEKCKIDYTRSKGNVSGFKSRQATNNFGFNLGDELKYIAYTDVEEAEIIDSPAGSQVYTFQFDGWTPCSGMSTVTDIDGNIYNTVQIGNQCWMKENLKTTSYNNDTVIPNVTDANAWGNLISGAFVWHENNISWKDSYGALYNWYTTIDDNGLCPTGWHVPSNDEWTELKDYIAGPGISVGKELKSCRQVNSQLGGSCNTNEHPRWNEDGTNYGIDNYGFSGLPGGHRLSIGAFGTLGFISYWWSSTEYSSNNAWCRNMYSQNGGMYVEYFPKNLGFSVRCLRD